MLEAMVSHKNIRKILRSHNNLRIYMIMRDRIVINNYDYTLQYIVVYDNMYPGHTLHYIVINNAIY